MNQYVGKANDTIIKVSYRGAVVVVTGKDKIH